MKLWRDRLHGLVVEVLTREGREIWTASCRWGRNAVARRGATAAAARDALRRFVERKLALDWPFGDEPAMSGAQTATEITENTEEITRGDRRG